MRDRVLNYYNANTRIFLLSEPHRKRRRMLHRRLRLPQTLTRNHKNGSGGNEDAVHSLLLDAFARFGLLRQPSPLILDLGCGVGGTISWLSERTGAELAGLTVSEVQATIARDGLGSGNQPRTQIATGSFEDPEALVALCSTAPPAAGYMIESFVHASSPEAVFAPLSSVATPGMLLVIIDDFPSNSLLQRLTGTNARHLRTLVRDFRDGWRINTFYPTGEIAASAARYGWSLEEEHDLTEHVDSSRPRDHLARASGELLRLFKNRTNYFDNVVGGGALQRLIRMRATRYEMLVFRYKPTRG